MVKGAFQFARGGHCKKGKQCHCIPIRTKNISLCSKPSNLFSFYAAPSIGKLKGILINSITWGALALGKMGEIVRSGLF